MLTEPNTNNNTQEQSARSAPQSSGGGAADQKSKIARVEIPSISLPNGGGAISGIGEKFQANPVTGSGSMTVPIAISPGRGGFSPQLALSYDSGAGNTAFGFGWSIGLPSISRKTSRGIPRYFDENESDVFLLAGAEDLVPILNDELETERVENGNQYSIKRYRPRVEGLFARIEHWKKEGKSTSFWKVITKENVTSIYGKNENSRLTHPDDASKIFKWNLESTFDDKGNLIEYEYKKEDKTNVGSHLFEENRNVSNSYLKRVRYGNEVSYLSDSYNSDSRFLFELVFDYGEHQLDGEDIPYYEEKTGWKERQDSFSSFRSSFDIRTYRLCRGIHLFHHIDEDGEWMAAPQIVKSTCLDLNENPIGTQVNAISYCFYKGTEKGSLPPVEFKYTKANPADTFQIIESESIENLPQGIDNNNYRWVDLYGEGISGVLSEFDGAWYYKSNSGNGKLEPMTQVLERPSIANLNQNANALTDVDGNGQLDLVSRRDGLKGYYEINVNGKWESFRPFEANPNIDWNDPNMRMIDLTGDGFGDILITEDNCFIWYASKAKEGFDPAQKVIHKLEEEYSPRLISNDRSQAIFLSDMTGDGLTDIVRIRNGEICYWANKGYGRFNHKITMANAPLFDHVDLFKPDNIRLADIDGSGTTDILYLKHNEVKYWLNQSGNSFSKKPFLIDSFPNINNLNTVNVFDLLGKGTACLVWSSPLPQDANAPLRYIDLMQQKPYLLCESKNNMGACTRMKYVSSTKFYLADKKAGTPWITKLPFPVHVLERVETYDKISDNRFVTTYAYRHAYFDGVEREFRGFGFVESYDSEVYQEGKNESLFSVKGKNWSYESEQEVSSDLPPVLTKTWFHLGYLEREDVISNQYENEYYQGDADAWKLPDIIFPKGIPSEEIRESARAMKGVMLRQEIYALDETDKAEHPYTVTESSFKIQRLQEKGANKHGVFFTTQEESLVYHYEREATDPRVAQTANLEIDEYGNVIHAASIVYPRRGAGHPPEQQERFITSQQTVLKHIAQELDNLRLNVPIESKAYRWSIPDDLNERLSIETLRLAILEGKKIKANGNEELVIEALIQADFNASIFQKRLLNHTQITYYDEDLNVEKSFRDINVLAIPFQTYTLAYTPAILAQEDLNDFLSASDMQKALTEGKYIERGTDWWIPSGIQKFDLSTTKDFIIPNGTQDPFGHTHTIEFDTHNLFPTKIIDPIGDVVASEYNYHFLQPKKLIDANLNFVEVDFDIRGMVVVTAAQSSKSGEENKADHLSNYNILLAEKNGTDNKATLLNESLNHLGDCTTYFYYDVWAWKNHRKPTYALAISRETHAEAIGGDTSKVQRAIVYSDGFGREILSKAQAENNQWIGSGKVIFNNKGLPYKQYEPYFSSDFEFEQMPPNGVSPILKYDPLGRNIRTEMPDGTFTKVEFTPWEQKTFDQNDTVLDSDWYVRMSSSPLDAEKVAATKAAAHADTLTTQHLDTLGRPFVSIAHNRINGTDYYVTTRTSLDIEGNPLTIRDGRNRTAPEEPGVISDAINHEGNQVMKYLYGMNGIQLFQNSMDAGKRWNILNVIGNPLFEGDDRNHLKNIVFDFLHRPTHIRIKIGHNLPDQNNPFTISEYMIFGTEAAKNEKGQLIQHFDGAGVVEYAQFDFKGNPWTSTRYLANLNENLDEITIAANDWNGIIDIEDAHSKGRLESDNFTSKTKVDALNRPTEATAPDSQQSTIKYEYNEAGMLEKQWVTIRNKSTTIIKNIDYNEKGQRKEIEYGNGVKTRYHYDPLTFRLVNLKSFKTKETFQDLHYTYDPVGNITQIEDKIVKPVYFDNQIVEGKSNYTYDALYQLIKAEGRENASRAMPDHKEIDNHYFKQLPITDKVVRNYVQLYKYDSAGNILEMKHKEKDKSANLWTRTYEYAPNNNRLLSENTNGFIYDNHGNMLEMRHLPTMQWDYKDQLVYTKIGNGGSDRRCFFTYDSQRQRVHKKHLQNSATTKERIYIGSFELYKEDGITKLETLHITDGEQRVCMVEIPDGGTPIFRYQLSDHLGSSSVELDKDAKGITYEEYHPFGSTAFRAMKKDSKYSQKRYRYTGMERDEETGLNYHSARYYITWLGRWCSTDPIEIEDGNNLFVYVKNSPIIHQDLTGTFGILIPHLLGLSKAKKMRLLGLAIELGLTISAPYRLKEDNPNTPETEIGIEWSGYESEDAYTPKDPTKTEPVPTKKKTTKKKPRTKKEKERARKRKEKRKAQKKARRKNRTSRVMHTPEIPSEPSNVPSSEQGPFLNPIPGYGLQTPIPELTPEAFEPQIGPLRGPVPEYGNQNPSRKEKSSTRRRLRKRSSSEGTGITPEEGAVGIMAGVIIVGSIALAGETFGFSLAIPELVGVTGVAVGVGAGVAKHESKEEY